MALINFLLWRSSCTVSYNGDILSYISSVLDCQQSLFCFKIVVNCQLAARRSHRHPRYLRHAGSELNVRHFESSTHAFVSAILEQKIDCAKVGKLE